MDGLVELDQALKLSRSATGLWVYLPYPPVRRAFPISYHKGAGLDLCRELYLSTDLFKLIGDCRRLFRRPSS